MVGMERVIGLFIHAWRGSTVVGANLGSHAPAHDRWDGIPAPPLARLDELMIEPKGRGAMC
ncbi:hypothetical protein BN1263470009 [Stenotrophomonas maltophilia]|nr:hypothetical protein BN1263470009 [Stenotrophomonas maltophilia]